VTKSKKTILILSVSAGTGHVRAAEALEQTAKLDFPELNAVHIDVIDYVPKFVRHLFSDSYIKIINRYPALWDFMYQKSDKVEAHSSKLKKLRLTIERLNAIKLNKMINKINPDHIICTHFLPSELLSHMIYKKKINIPCWVQVTDYHIHGLWVQPNHFGYFVASDEVAWRIRDYGVPIDKIYVTGIPVAPVFFQNLPKQECAAEIGISADKTTLLVMSGGFGIGRIYELTEGLLSMNIDAQIVVLAGRNRVLLNRLQKLATKHNNRFVPLGFTSQIEQVMAVSDIAISKPGGLTTSECLATNLPMIIISPIPGQEERNANYLLENGAALKACDITGLEFRIKELLNNKTKLEKIRQNMSAIVRPNAAKDVLRIVLQGG